MRRAEQLGVTDEICALMGGYLDQVERAQEGYEDFHWGERAEHTEILQVPAVDPIMYELGPLVEVVYEASKGGDLYHWHHAFDGELPVLAYGDSGTLWVLGGDYQVTPRGIVG